MKRLKNGVLSLLSVLAVLSCGEKKPAQEVKLTDKQLLIEIEGQYEMLHTTATPHISEENYIPRTINDDGTTRFVGNYNWTSGFYAGSLWYLYGLNNDAKWKKRAIEYTEKLDTIQYWGGNHDVGFIMECSYGNGIKFSNDKAETYDKIIVQTAKSLATRFVPKAGIIQSWNSSSRWDCPVIIDNMMNLELMFHATKISRDSTYYQIAVSHADNTIKNHYREDNSSIHVLDYDRENGEILQRKTAQGFKDDSAWARGQAWGLYGFTVCYRETKNEAYLKQAKKIANFIKSHPNLPEDQIPLWDYDVTAEPDTERDASAAAIAASAMIELSTFVPEEESKEYLQWAYRILESLTSKAYRAEVGTNNGFLLKHSVGSIPHNVEIDVPLNYADYYYLEALYRKKFWF
ncbi:glucuronyl hydrolase [Maribacter sp. 2304DJ31-5]|uniref:glucuronyl hydrolase n=1 Tax=Maribacter sp. 2304DJ31-5 TaxID=3386273 RepID=UPI0039BC7271